MTLFHSTTTDNNKPHKPYVRLHVYARYLHIFYVIVEVQRTEESIKLKNGRLEERQLSNTRGRYDVGRVTGTLVTSSILSNEPNISNSAKAVANGGSSSVVHSKYVTVRPHFTLLD